MVAVAGTEPQPRGMVLAGAYALVGLIGLLTLVGAFIALGTLRGSPAAHQHVHTVAAPVPTDDVGRSLRTSFGVFALENVEKLTGLTRKQLGGMTHFPSYIAPNLMQVQVALQITNLKNHTVDYSPGQFRLVLGNGRPIKLARTTIPGGTLQPSASIDGLLTFIAPRRSKGRDHLWLEFRDAGTTTPIRADLGLARTKGKVPAVDTQAHGHLNHQRPPPTK
jgi:hypothetical protein